MSLKKHRCAVLLLLLLLLVTTTLMLQGGGVSALTTYNIACDPIEEGHNILSVLDVLLTPAFRTNDSRIQDGDIVKVNFTFWWLRNPPLNTLPQRVDWPQWRVEAFSSDEYTLKILDSNQNLTERFLNDTAIFREVPTSSLSSKSTKTCEYVMYSDEFSVAGDLLGSSYLALVVHNGSTNYTSKSWFQSFHHSGITLDAQNSSGGNVNMAWDVVRFIVLRQFRVVETIFRVVITILISVMTFSMGASLDPKIILSYLKRPIAPAIGFGCQYLVMPLLAFGLAMAVPIGKPMGFGLVTIGCSPGGGGSNVWTVLLGGDLNLSMVMTFLSSVAALGMMPLWLFLLKGFFLESHVRVPFDNIALNLLMILVPVLLGMALRWKFLKAALLVCRITKPLAIIFVVYVLTFGTYVNWYIFRIFYRTPLLVFVGAMLPWFGFLGGGLVAFLLRQTRPQITAIALETGIQNIGVAILILMYSLPQPEGSLGAAMPVAVALFTPLPLYILLAVMKIRQRFFTPRKPKKPVGAPIDDEPPELNHQDDDGTISRASVASSAGAAAEYNLSQQPAGEEAIPLKTHNTHSTDM